MADSLNLYQKLSKVMGDIDKVEKTGKNTQQGYDFVEQAVVLATLRPKLSEHNIIIIPAVTNHEVERFTNAKGTTVFHTVLTTKYTVVNGDDPAERIEAEWRGEALDYSDKAVNKAMTASQKYFLMKLFNISDKDDPDQEHPLVPKDSPVESKVTPSQLKKISDTLKALDIADAKQQIVLRAIMGDQDLNIRSISYLEADKLIKELQATDGEVLKNMANKEPF